MTVCAWWSHYQCHPKNLPYDRAYILQYTLQVSSSRGTIVQKNGERMKRFLLLHMNFLFMRWRLIIISYGNKTRFRICHLYKLHCKRKEVSLLFTFLFFCMWIFSYHRTVCWKYCSVSIMFSWHPCIRSIALRHLSLYLDSQIYSIYLYFYTVVCITLYCLL